MTMHWHEMLKRIMVPTIFLLKKQVDMSASNSSFIMLLTAVLFSSCELYDLRPPEYNAAENPEDPKKARAIIDNCIEAHGWDEVDSPVIEVTYTDEWPSFLFRLFFHPWPSRHQKIKHQRLCIVCQARGRVIFKGNRCQFLPPHLPVFFSNAFMDEGYTLFGLSG